MTLGWKEYWNPRTREMESRGSPEQWHLEKKGGQKGSNSLATGTHGTSEKGLYLIECTPVSTAGIHTDGRKIPDCHMDLQV